MRAVIWTGASDQLGQRVETSRSRWTEEKWLAALDDFHNWLIREAAW